MQLFAADTDAAATANDTAAAATDITATTYDAIVAVTADTAALISLPNTSSHKLFKILDRSL